MPAVDTTAIPVHATPALARGSRSLEIGIDSFAASVPNPASGQATLPAERMEELLLEIEAADRVGIDVFGIGEHHRKEFLDSAPVVILGAAAARTRRIRLTSAVTVLSAADPVRVFQEFATLDLLSRGRAEIVVGRGSFGEAFSLFGYSQNDYDALFAEKLELLLKLNDDAFPEWRGRFRAPLDGQGVFPRPHQARLPIWLGVGGTPQSFVRAGTLGLPLMIGVIGGSFEQFRPLVDLYRQAGLLAGHKAEVLKVGLHAMGFVAETSDDARNVFFPGWAHMFGEVGRERGWSRPSRAQFDAMCSPRGAFLIGDPATVAERVLEVDRLLGGLSRVTLQMSTAMWETAAMRRSIELLGTEIAPRLRKAINTPRTTSAA